MLVFLASLQTTSSAGMFEKGWGLKMDLLNLSPFLFQIQQTIIFLLKRK